MKNLYYIRSGSVVELTDKWRIKIIKLSKKSSNEEKEYFRKKALISLLLCSKSEVADDLFKIKNEYYLAGGSLGEGFDIVREYKSFIQEELEI